MEIRGELLNGSPFDNKMGNISGFIGDILIIDY